MSMNDMQNPRPHDERQVIRDKDIMNMQDSLRTIYSSIRAEIERAGYTVENVCSWLRLGPSFPEAVREKAPGEVEDDILTSKIVAIAVFLDIDVGVLLYGREKYAEMVSKERSIERPVYTAEQGDEERQRREQMKSFVKASDSLDDFLRNGIIADTYGNPEAIVEDIARNVRRRLNAGLDI